MMKAIENPAPPVTTHRCERCGHDTSMDAAMPERVETITTCPEGGAHVFVAKPV